MYSMWDSILERETKVHSALAMPEPHLPTRLLLW
jgi:hypothetical protein